MISGKTILQLPGAGKVFHFFKRVTDYVVAMQTITSDSSDYKEFSFLTGKFASGEVLPGIDFQHVHDFDYRQGEWVKVLYETEPHSGLILDVNTSEKLICVTCLVPSHGKHWKLESEGIQFAIVSPMCLGDQIMIQQWTDKGCLYKL